jgi:hypothetical protein
MEFTVSHIDSRDISSALTMNTDWCERGGIVGRGILIDMVSPSGLASDAYVG